jgi:hypothetical protein
MFRDTCHCPIQTATFTSLGQLLFWDLRNFPAEDSHNTYSFCKSYKCTDRVRNEQVLHIMKKKRNILRTIKRRKAIKIHRILRTNCLLKRIFERTIDGRGDGMAWDDVVGIATRQGLEDPGIESLWLWPPAPSSVEVHRKLYLYSKGLRRL